MLDCRTLQSRPSRSNSAKHAVVANERRLYVALPREGEPSGISRIFCLYREKGLEVTTAIVSPAARDEGSARRVIAQTASISVKTNLALVVPHERPVAGQNHRSRF